MSKRTRRRVKVLLIAEFEVRGRDPLALGRFDQGPRGRRPQFELGQLVEQTLDPLGPRGGAESLSDGGKGGAPLAFLGLW